ncbi:hypothetical protein CRYUN_Cryun12cG0116800 [Craigia yunnanensis]
MMIDLKLPFHKDTIPFWAVPVFPCSITSFSYFFHILLFRKDVYDFHHAILGLLFSALLTGVIMDSIKDVARPRINFFWRCIPDGKAVCLMSLLPIHITTSLNSFVERGLLKIAFHCFLVS